jgi:hypothetical protein
MVDFWPARNGFHFSNNNIKWSFGPFSGKALCDGMVYAAMDYWYAGMQIPDTTYVPDEKTPLHSYIYNRQLYAHNNTLGKFIDSWIRRSPGGGKRQTRQWHSLWKAAGCLPVRWLQARPPCARVQLFPAVQEDVHLRSEQ